MVLVAECGGGDEEEGAGDYGEDEGETEEEERGVGEGVAVPGWEGGAVGGGAEFLGGEGWWHCYLGGVVGNGMVWHGGGCVQTRMRLSHLLLIYGVMS